MCVSICILIAFTCNLMLHLAAVLSGQATVQLHEWVKTFVLVGEEGWDIAKQSRGKLLQWYMVSCT